MSDPEFVKTVDEDDTSELLFNFQRKLIDDMSIVTMSYVHGFVNKNTKASIAIREQLEKDINYYVNSRIADLKSQIL